MPPFILITIMLLAAAFFIEVFVMPPLNILGSINLFNWLTFGTIVVVLIWCFGE